MTAESRHHTGDTVPLDCSSGMGDSRMKGVNPEIYER
jgi:hypothetical protein